MHSPETRKKISEARKAFFLTPRGDQERKRKSEEAKLRYQNPQKHPMFGRTQTKSSKRKNSETNSRTWANKILEGQGLWSRQYRRGVFYSKKMQREFGYRSSWERLFFYLLDHSEKVQSFEVEPFFIEYEFQDKVRRYIPDVIVTLENLRFLIEIKPSRLRNKDRNIQKAIAAKQYCLKHGVEYLMLSEGDLWRFILTHDPETLFHLPEKFQSEVLSIINRIGSKLIA